MKMWSFTALLVGMVGAVSIPNIAPNAPASIPMGSAAVAELQDPDPDFVTDVDAIPGQYVVSFDDGYPDDYGGTSDNPSRPEAVWGCPCPASRPQNPSRARMAG
jgi:hypothetical protein